MTEALGSPRGKRLHDKKLMFHAETMNERRALHLRHGDMVVVWRMVKGALMLGKRSHHRMRPAILSVWSAVRGNCWVTLLGRVMKASPEQLRQAGRENRHAWRLVEGELRAKRVNSDEFSGHRFEDITSGELPPAEEEVKGWTRWEVLNSAQKHTRASDDGLLEQAPLLMVIWLNRVLWENASERTRIRLSRPMQSQRDIIEREVSKTCAGRLECSAASNTGRITCPPGISLPAAMCGVSCEDERPRTRLCRHMAEP